MFSARYTPLVDPIFLKASNCIDIHSTGALAYFAVLMTAETQQPESRQLAGNMLILNRHTMEFVKLSNEIYTSLYDDVKSSSTENLDQSHYVMTSSEYADNARDKMKQHSGKHFVLLSMVCCPDNINKLCESIICDKSAQRAVKVMKRQKKHKHAGSEQATTYTSFVRIKTYPGQGIEGETSLLQVEDGKGNYILVTPTHALMAQDGQMYKCGNYNTLTRTQFDTANKEFQNCSDITKISQCVFDGQDVEAYKYAAVDDSDNTPTPVVVLCHAKTPVELMSSLTPDTREKVLESKESNPTQYYSASSLINSQGSAFKNAQTVSLAFMDCPGMLSAYTLTTLLLETSQSD